MNNDFSHDFFDLRYFKDLEHLNDLGRLKVSAALAERLAKAMKAGAKPLVKASTESRY